MHEVRQLAGKLYGKELESGDDAFSLEVRRWCPDRDPSQDVPQIDFGTMDAIERLGLMGDKATVGQRLREFVSEETRSGGEVSDAERRERFSFAVSRSLDLDDATLQHLMYAVSTEQRLEALEAVVLEGRNYLAARAALKDAGL